MVNKFSEHLPLYRQQDVLARHGIFLARSTLCGWMAQCAQLLRPLVELMRQRVVQSDVINADETPVRVLDRTRDSTRKGQFWTYISPGDHGYTIYDLSRFAQPGRPSRVPQGFPRLFADGRLCGVRIRGLGIGRPDHSGGLLGPCAA